MVGCLKVDMRKRQWRRFQAEKKLEKVFHNEMYYKYYKYNLNLFNYDKKISITDTEKIFVYDVFDFIKYKRFKSRLLRDNPKKCGCRSCQNPRKLYDGKNKTSLTIKEKINLEKFNYDIKLNWTDCFLNDMIFK